MGPERHGCVVSGIGIAIAGATTTTAPPQRLSCSILFTSGAGPLTVNGSSGNCSQNAEKYGVVYVSITGGTQPYSGTVSLAGDASGKLALVPVPGDPFGHSTIGWNSLSLNEYEGCYLAYNVTDAVGETASAAYPDEGVIVLKRAS